MYSIRRWGVPLDWGEQLLKRGGAFDEPVECSLGVHKHGDKVLVVVGSQVVQPLVDALEISIMQTNLLI